MRYAITSSQLSYLRKEGEIELEALFSPEEVGNLRHCIELAAAKSETGRDIQREDPPLLNALHLSHLGQIASGLFAKKSLRLAFTQYGPIFHNTISIKELSSISETCGGCTIDLESGNITFYTPDHPILFPELTPYFFLAFATDKARYKLQEKDIHTHFLKKLGYGFGDLLTVKTHPLIAK